MKKFLFLIFSIFSGFYFSQNINFAPFNNHYFAPYSATVTSPSATMYYTIDGSTPTLSSASATNSFTVNISQNLTIKAFAVDSQGSTSTIFTNK